MDKPSRVAKVVLKDPVVAQWLWRTHNMVEKSGIRRYTLAIPKHQKEAARLAGCRNIGGLWYIDNPANLADFAAWKPRRLNFAKVKEEIVGKKWDIDSF